MARNPESDRAAPADPARVRNLLLDLGVIAPVELSDRERALLDLDDFPDTEEGRRQFAAAMRALTGR